MQTTDVVLYGVINMLSFYSYVFTFILLDFLFYGWTFKFNNLSNNEYMSRISWVIYLMRFMKSF